jgi:GNAT superfamily N-acetyltransferase
VTKTKTAELERLRAYQREHFERVATRAEPFAHGMVVFTPEHSTKWDSNLLVVEDAAGVSAEELIAEAERLRAPAALRHRKIQVLSGGDGLADGFTAAGWTAETLVVMALHGADTRGDTPQAEVRETGFDAVRPLMEAWYRESMGEAEARDLGDADADAAARTGARYFLVERHGEPAASCELLGFGGIGQVESVYTAAAHRGHGLASVVVRTAIAAARERGDDLVMIMADAGDWPQKLYERIGSRPSTHT